MGQLEIYLTILGLSGDDISLPKQVFGIDFNGVIYSINLTGKPTPSFKFEFDKDCLIGYNGSKAYFKFERLFTPNQEKLSLEKALNFISEWENTPSLICCFPPFKFREIFESFDKMDKPIPLIRLAREYAQLFNKEVHEITAVLEKMLVKISEAKESKVKGSFTVYRTYKTRIKESYDNKPIFEIVR